MNDNDWNISKPNRNQSKNPEGNQFFQALAQRLIAIDKNKQIIAIRAR
jgi:hypothetical protein